MTDKLAHRDEATNPTAALVRGHLPALDGIRGMAILVVVIYHSNIIHRPSSSAEHLWFGIVNAGWFGVDLFFVLSGFLITGILWDAKGKAGYFRSFWVRRVLRIFPLYYLFLAVSFFVFPLLTELLRDGTLVKDLDQVSPAWFWAYLPNALFASAGDFVGPRHLAATWSLGIEEQFYVLWPVVVFFLSRRWLLRVCVFGSVLALAIRLVLISQDVHWITIFVLPFTRMDTLLMGAALAVWLRTQEGLSVERLRLISALAASVGAITVVGYVITKGQLAQYDRMVHGVGFTVLSLTFLGILVHALSAKKPSIYRRLIELAPLRFVGRYAYGLYLSHPIVQFFVVSKVLNLELLHLQLGQSRVAVQLAFTLVSTLASIAFAFVLFHIFERHFLRLKRLFPMPSAVPNGAPSATSAAAVQSTAPSSQKADLAP